MAAGRTECRTGAWGADDRYFLRSSSTGGAACCDFPRSARRQPVAGERSQRPRAGSPPQRCDPAGDRTDQEHVRVLAGGGPRPAAQRGVRPSAVVSPRLASPSERQTAPRTQARRSNGRRRQQTVETSSFRPRRRAAPAAPAYHAPHRTTTGRSEDRRHSQTSSAENPPPTSNRKSSPVTDNKLRRGPSRSASWRPRDENRVTS